LRTMDRNTVSEAQVQDWLRTLGITSLYQWDVVLFLYRHRESLLGAAHLARLLGYETELIVIAMEELEALRLVVRSRISQGARFYHFTPPSQTHRITALDELLAFTSYRAGRLQLSRLLQRGEQRAHANRQMAQPRLAAVKQASPLAPRVPISRHPRKDITWLKVI